MSSLTLFSSIAANGGGGVPKTLWRLLSVPSPAARSASLSQRPRQRASLSVRDTSNAEVSHMSAISASPRPGALRAVRTIRRLSLRETTSQSYWEPPKGARQRMPCVATERPVTAFERLVGSGTKAPGTNIPAAISSASRRAQQRSSIVAGPGGGLHGRRSHVRMVVMVWDCGELRKP